MKVKFDFGPLIKTVENQERALKSLSSRDKGFEMTNVARDVGRKSSTKRYYFDLVDKGRAGFEATGFTDAISKLGKKFKRKKVLAFKTGPSEADWVFTIRVGSAPPLRLRQQINRRLKRELSSVMKEVLGDRTIPLAVDIVRINNIMKQRALIIAQEVTLANTKQHRTRQEFYKISAAISLADGYRIVEKR